MTFKNIDLFIAVALVICLASVCFGNMAGAVATLALLLVRDEVLRPYFYKKEETPLSNAIIQAQLDNIQRELNTIKLDKAMRTLT